MIFPSGGILYTACGIYCVRFDQPNCFCNIFRGQSSGKNAWTDIFRVPEYLLCDLFFDALSGTAWLPRSVCIEKK